MFRLLQRLFSQVLRKIWPTLGLVHGRNLCISRRCFFDYPKQVKFGNDVFVNKFCQFHIGYSDATIVIGDNVWIGMDVCFICPTHEIGSSKQRAGKRIYDGIVVGKGTWIGARCTILPGVSIGEGCIIAAGSIVNRNVPDNTIYGGSPAKYIKHLD